MNYLFNIYVFDIFPFRYFSLSTFFFSTFFLFDIFPFDISTATHSMAYSLSYPIGILLYDISIKLFLQKLCVIIEFCDNGAKSSLRLTEDIADCE